MSSIEQIINQSMPGFERIAQQRKLVRWQEESQFAYQAVKQSARLQECDPQTIQDAIINVAAVGLTLNPAYGYAYLVPDTIKVGKDQQGKDVWRAVCQLRVSFKGIIKLANDSGVAEWVHADVVHKKDSFTYCGAWEKPIHQMDPFSEERGAPVGVYCTIKTKTGGYLTECAPWSEVMKAKAAAKTKYVWDQWEGEMAKKFIIKRASKQWPKSDGHLLEAINVIDQYEGSAELNQLDRVAAEIMSIIYDETSEQDRAERLNEVIGELDEAEMQTLWTAKTKGGWFTQADKALIRELRSLNAATLEQLMEKPVGDAA